MSVLFGQRVLILAPHPDDEVVACSAAIGRAIAAGAAVHVLFLTHGCLDRETLWPWDRPGFEAMAATRRAESEAAAADLGVAVVGRSARPARRLWRELAEAEAEVRAATLAHAIDQLWAPAYEGGNPDHDGASALAARFAAEGLSVIEFAEYNLAGGKALSHAFPQPTGAEEVLTLTDTERAAKRRRLALYASERGNLGYVETEREALRPLAHYDFAGPPHAGRLWYERFQWVPFRHPRVDFTASAEVSAAITAYLAAPGRPLTPP
ncbi:MAG: PIG-L family deacetylase [Caulobacterales bacterium]